MIALGPPQPDQQDKQEDSFKEKQEEKDGNQEEQPEEQEEPVFQDEVKVNGKTVLNIPLGMAYYEEKKKKRKSRWGERETKKSTLYSIVVEVHLDVTFDPLKAIEFPKELLALTNGDSDIARLFDQQGGNLSSHNTAPPNSKWHDEWEKSFTAPALNVIPRKLEQDELEYVIRLYRLDELNKKLQINDVVQWDPDLRSPSPEPIYDPKTGMRSNTREQRGRDKLLREQSDLIEECKLLKPNTFVAPNDYRPLKKEKRIFLPEDDPDVNYIGIILGPRGSTQKILENKSGCRISIRGRGTKQGKFNSDEKMHVLLQAESDTALERGAELIDKLLRGEDAEVNEIKQSQQYQLQVIQGLIKEDYCENCHEKGHRTWACPNSAIWNKDLIKCSLCGDRSHPAIDCPQRAQQLNQHQALPGNKIEQEFANFLCELEGGEKAQALLSMASEHKAPQKALKSKSSFLTENVTDILAITQGNKSDYSWQQYVDQKLSIAQGLAQMNPADREKLLNGQALRQKMMQNNTIREEVSQPAQLKSLGTDSTQQGHIAYHYNPQYQDYPMGQDSRPALLNITSLTPLNQQQAFIQKMNNMTLPQFELEEQQVNKDMAMYLNPTDPPPLQKPYNYQ